MTSGQDKMKVMETERKAGPELDALVAELIGKGPAGKARFSGCNEPEPYTINKDGNAVPWHPKPYSTGRRPSQWKPYIQF